MTYDGSDLVDVGGLRDAAIGDDLIEEGLEELPFLEEVPEEYAVFRIVLVVFHGGSGGRGSCGGGGGEILH